MLERYQKAYFRDKSFTAWQNGVYHSLAIGIALQCPDKKKGEKRQDYPEWQDPFENEYKEKQEKNINKIYRESLIGEEMAIRQILGME